MFKLKVSGNTWRSRPLIFLWFSQILQCSFLSFGLRLGARRSGVVGSGGTGGEGKVLIVTTHLDVPELRESTVRPPVEGVEDVRVVPRPRRQRESGNEAGE